MEIHITRATIRERIAATDQCTPVLTRGRGSRRQCRLDDCTGQLHSATTELCKKHHYRQLRHGNPHVVLPRGAKAGPGHPNTKPLPGYDAMHVRLKSWRGPASNFACVDDCGRPAAEWSYVGGDPDERVDRQRGNAYSTDLDRYAPRCYPCHRAHDLAARGGRRSRAA